MDILSNYKSFLITDQNASRNTIDGYISDIKGLIEFEGTPSNFADVTSNDLRKYISDLVEKGRKRSTINRAVCALKSFFSYLEGEKLIGKSPAVTLKTTKKEKSLPKYLSEAEVRAIMGAASTSSLKDQLVLELLYGSGGRVSEVVCLQVEDIDFEEDFISLFGKGEKERSNPLHKRGIDLIKKYMKAYGITSGYLFPGRLDSNKHMTRTNALYMCKRIAEKAGVDPAKVSPHVFRHSFATHFLERGGDLAMIQDLLGHEDPATTRIYAKVTKKAKKESYAMHHPLS